MKSKKLVAFSAATVLTLGLSVAPAAMATAAPPQPGQVAHVDHATWKQARKELRVALDSAQTQFRTDIKAAIAAFKVATMDDRLVLRAVLTDRTATKAEKAAARKQFLADTKADRLVFWNARKTAIATRHDTVKAAWRTFRAAVS